MLLLKPMLFRLLVHRLNNQWLNRLLDHLELLLPLLMDKLLGL